MHFLQSPAWEAFQNKLGRKTFHRSGEGWSYMAILEPGKFGTTRLYCPYGPTVESERALKTALESLRALAKSHKATAVRIEPVGVANLDGFLKKHGLHKINYSSPATTWHIDLTQDNEAIVAAMNQNNRNVYRNYHKKGLKHTVSKKPGDYKYLTHLLHGVATHNHITVHSDDYLKTQVQVLMKQKAAELHFMWYEKKVIAAALVYLDDTTAYYAHAAADHEHRKLNASTALLAEIIMHAKKDGKQLCDLYGITTSDDSTHRWAGFTKFKKSFGGFQVDYSDTYELPIRKIRYALYNLAKTIKRLTV